MEISIWRLIVFLFTCGFLIFSFTYVIKNFWEHLETPWYKDIGVITAIIGMIGFSILMIFKTN